jgi:hypothetical protein
VDPVPAVLDHERREQEVDTDKGGQHECVPAGQQDEQAGCGERDAAHCPAHLPERDPVVLNPPPGQERERVGECGRADEPVVRNEDRQQRRQGRSGNDRSPSSRDQAVGSQPDECDQGERRDVEHVALLDLVH